MSGLEDLAGKAAVVTGGASGIGKGIARRLIDSGMRVIVADVEDAALERAAAELGAHPVRVDVSSAESVKGLAEEALRRFGTVHVVCNNAGVGPAARIADMSLSDWRWILDVNLWGVIHGVQAFLPILLANRDGGHIVNTASIGGLTTMPTLGGYAVTKYGVVALSETLALELAEQGSNVGVSILCPGPVRTNIKASSRNRPADLPQGGLADVDIEASGAAEGARWISPEEAGDVVVRAIRRGDLYAFTHPEMEAAVDERHERIRLAFHDWRQPA